MQFTDFSNGSSPALFEQQNLRLAKPRLNLNILKCSEEDKEQEGSAKLFGLDSPEMMDQPSPLPLQSMAKSISYQMPVKLAYFGNRCMYEGPKSRLIHSEEPAEKEQSSSFSSHSLSASKRRNKENSFSNDSLINCINRYEMPEDAPSSLKSIMGFLDKKGIDEINVKQYIEERGRYRKFTERLSVISFMGEAQEQPLGDRMESPVKPVIPSLVLRRQMFRKSTSMGQNNAQSRLLQMLSKKPAEEEERKVEREEGEHIS
mmetsp:Transcript_4723/g.8068  ORF Transcript_4723/g.8068 Transcript_4723/m.8068 type:complete len:260 (-) Transcript_4723:322-1101(-)